MATCMNRNHRGPDLEGDCDCQDPSRCGDCHLVKAADQMFNSDTCIDCQARRSEHQTNYPWA